MAGRVGPVLSVLIPPPLNLAPAHCVTGGYGFTLHKDIVSGGGTPSMTLIYETREEAAEARELVANAFAKAKSATGPGSR